VLSLVTLAVYLSASEVEVSKCVFYIETHHKILEGLKTVSWLFSVVCYKPLVLAGGGYYESSLLWYTEKQLCAGRP